MYKHVNYKLVWMGYVLAMAAGAGVAGAWGTVWAASAPVTLQVKVGDAMPEFDLPNYDGQAYSLAAVKGQIVVLEFSSQACPYSAGVAPSLNQLAKDYKEKGVVVWSIDSHRSTTPEEIQAYASKEGLVFPILKDTGNAYADQVGATRTPEMFVLDKAHRISYYGAFDDRSDPSKIGETPYVRNALDALLAGKPVEPAEVTPWGCTIKRAEAASQTK